MYNALKKRKKERKSENAGHFEIQNVISKY